MRANLALNRAPECHSVARGNLLSDWLLDDDLNGAVT